LILVCQTGEVHLIFKPQLCDEIVKGDLQYFAAVHNSFPKFQYHYAKQRSEQELQLSSQKKQDLLMKKRNKLLINIWF
jgi:hypothetical protein